MNGKSISLAFIFIFSRLVWCDAQDTGWLDELKLSYAKIDNFEILLQNDETYKRLPDNATQYSSQSIEFRKSLKRWSILNKLTGNSWNNSQKINRSVCQNLVVGERQSISVRAQNGKNYLGKIYGTANEVPLPVLASEMEIIGSIDATFPIEQLAPIDYINECKFMFGYTDAWTYLPDVLQAAREIHSPSFVQIPNCIIVQSRGKKGLFTLWLDKMNGYLPRRVENLRNVGDAYADNKVLGQIAKIKPGRIWPTESLISTELLVDKVEFSQIKNHAITSSFRVTLSYKYKNGAVLVKSNTISSSNLQDISSFPFKPAVTIPVNSSVQISSVPQINYIWDGNSIVPDQSKDSLKQFDALPFMPGKSSTVFYVALVSLAVVVVGLVYKLKHAGRKV